MFYSLPPLLVSLITYKINPTENDGEKLFSLLRSRQTPEDIRDCMGRIEGP